MYEGEYYWTGNYEDYLQRYQKYRNTANEIKHLIKGPVLDYGCAVGFMAMALQELGIEVQGYDLSPWPIQYGKNTLHADNITDVWSECNDSYQTMLVLDVFEHMTLKDIDQVLSKVNAPTLMARVPVTNRVGEDFVLAISRRDDTHRICFTKGQWEDIFAMHGYKLHQILDFKTIWDSEGVLSRIYVKD